MARFFFILLAGTALPFFGGQFLQPAKAADSLAALVVKAAEESSESGETDDDEDDEDRLQNQLALNEHRLARLKKPLSDIRVVAATASADSPQGGASDLLDTQTGIVITSSGLSPATPDRYTVGSYHRPLYFEELNLERCGETYGCATNLISGVHFLTNTVALPYRLATQRPDCPVPSHGDCQSCQSFSHDIEPFGFEPKGVLVEAAAIAGFIFLAM
jgi:hypothetical protein